MTLSRAIGTIALVCLLPAQWLAVLALGGELGHPAHAVSSGFAIFGAAFLLSWAAETGQVDIPQALALAFLALVAVLPEYAVDLYFAYRAGSHPEYAAFATANMTGANRLLIGLGWPAVVAALWLAKRRGTIYLKRDEALELTCLAIATLYAFFVAWKGSLGLVDAVLLLALFAFYMVSAGRTKHEETELEGIPDALARHLSPTGRRIAVIALFVVSAGTILISAEPFAESLLGIGREFHIEEFLLVQWLAPLASESPEFIVAILFAVSGKANAGLRALVSSKVNQWTLLVGALPAAYALSHGSLHPMILDARQREEIFLTSAQSVFGLCVIANFRFAVGEALALFVLFAAQLVFTSPAARWLYAGGYLGLAAGMLIASRDTRRGVLHLLPGTGK